MFIINNCGTNVYEKNDSKIEIMHEGCILDTKLELVSKKFPLGVKVVFTNNLNKDLAIPKYCINVYKKSANLLTNTYFLILNEKNKSPDYAGILRKIDIGSATLENCVILEKGKSVSIEIPNLMDSYNFENFDYKELHIQYQGWLGVSNEVIIKAEEINGK